MLLDEKLNRRQISYLMVEKTINTLDAYMEVLNAQCEAEYTDELENKILALARLTNKWIAAIQSITTSEHLWPSFAILSPDFYREDVDYS